MNLTIGLVGNPNCGKTTVFNNLTGARQRVGNWPGVTVERKSGVFKWQSKTVDVVDLPGTYSLVSASQASSIDERIACEFILTRQADVIVNILDASNLERNLYLTTQLLEMRVPVIVAVNMMDVVRQRGQQILIDVLERELGCPVVQLEANRGKGIKDLKQAIVAIGKSLQPSEKKIKYPELIQKVIGEIRASLAPGSKDASEWLAIRLLEDDVLAHNLITQELQQQVIKAQIRIRDTLHEDADILLADARYRFIQGMVSQCVIKNANPIPTWTLRIDNLVLNRVLGIPIFLGVMYCMFLFAINIGGAFQDFFDIGSDTLFVSGLAEGLAYLHAPSWLIALLASGIGKGINTTITFIPVIGAMFLALAFLEDSGYMARAAFVIDRLMRAMGLPGKSFVPMIVGFGCNVPSVMGARTLENKRDRILTVMMSPFMSCGARLAIYAVFTAAFFPVGGQNVVFTLYLIGIGMAMLTGLLLRKTLLKGDPAPLVMELPPYHVPHVKTLCLHAWQRLKSFVFRAGKLIVPICILIGALNGLNIDGSLNAAEGDTHSLLSSLGQWLTPIFAPMGIHQDNWPATVGLVTGVLAKEVVVGTLNTLYSQLGHFALQAETFSFWGGLHDALASIPANLSQIGSSLGNPVLAKAPVHTLSQGVYGLMYERFDGRVGAMAYLLFVLLYFPCVSTTAAMVRELNRFWAGFSVLWTTVVAYGTAVGFYQLATFARHPLVSFLWLVGIVGVFLAIIMGMHIASAPRKLGRVIAKEAA
ncbi:MAG: Fe(2+) transporter permease subunit FeoB [Gammaproteobacteria bacterium]